MAEPPEKKEKVCHSCGLDDQGQSTLLDADGAREAFAALPENLWTLEDTRLTRKFTAKNFLQAVAFVNAVAPRAEINRGDPHAIVSELGVPRRSRRSPRTRDTTPTFISQIIGKSSSCSRRTRRVA